MGYLDESQEFGKFRFSETDTM